MTGERSQRRFVDAARVGLRDRARIVHQQPLLPHRVGGDIRAAHATLEGRGVEFIDAPHMIHHHDDGTEEWMAFFKDIYGRPLAIMAQVPA